MKLIKFSASFCQPCKVLAKQLDTLEVAYQDVDIMKEMEYAKKYNIRNVPTLIITSDEGAELFRFSPQIETLQEFLLNLEK